ncbi:MAG: DNA repair protein RecN [Gammaproteobacteria bacterium]|nr:DNA repair protein RecN [Gammaproteobacteria bacterium]
MLTDLSIRDYAIVQRLDIELHAGMTCVTGETGAGKSIMLDALGLCIGDRAEAQAVRAGADRAEISALFSIEKLPEAQAWLDRAALLEGHECLIRRTVSSDGRSRAFINGSSATLAQCKELGELLVDLHSQHAHQSLLRRSVQRELLDAFSETAAEALSIAEEANCIRTLKHELETLRSSSNEIAERRDLLNYQIDELSGLSFGDAELESLESDQKLLSNASWIMETVHAIAEQCGGLSDQLRSSVSQLSDDRLGNKIDESRELVLSSQIQLDEAASELRRFLAGVELDPQRLREVESRLDTAYTLARKHRIRPEELAGHLETLSNELENLEYGSQRLDELESEIEARHARWTENAQALTEKRKQGARRLAERSMELLAQLAMERCELDVGFIEIAAEKLDPRGLEEVEIWIATNPGSQPGPLNKVASGGELSRISLALQVAVADKATAPTMIFDEVDVGVGGAVADVVGALLKTLADNVQVLCVTHLPQVAAKGHQHIQVSKTGDHVVTTSLQYLSDDERVEELSRMLGGAVVTDATRENARELLAAT